MLKFLSGSVTQGSADAFATAEIATGLANASLGYRVRGITFQWPIPVEVDSGVLLQLCRRTPSAALTLGDRTLLWSERKNIAITTSGMYVYEVFSNILIPKDMEMLIVEDPIFFSIDSETTSAANNARCRVYYEEVRLTETAKLAALTESLNA